jgi:hypothetical protein
MGLFDKPKANELFEDNKDAGLEAYFLAFRDLIKDSPMIPTNAEEEGKLDVFSLQEISSKLNRFHVSGNPDSIGDILERMFPAREKKDHLDLLVRVLVDGCNRKVKEELPDYVESGEVSLLNVDADGTASYFQSFAEAMQLVIRMRLRETD